MREQELFKAEPRIVVVGLGYVGLPLAIALASRFEVIGVDISASRVAELRAGFDRTNEVDAATLRDTALSLTTDLAACRGRDIYIVTVPTPVDADKKPDLGPLIAASKSVGQMLDAAHSPIVVFESTVYPGVTEDVCGPLLEQASGLTMGRDFFLGYSPERINPGDREHTIAKITKVVAGQDSAVVDRLSDMYGAITSGGVFRAKSIKAAEAAKVIENAQRDINIAFMNEITQIFSKLDLSIWDVLEAARTKWNFLPFQPGLVGGHCIGVDPYYLSFRAQELGHEPTVILAGRDTNDGMGGWVAGQLAALCPAKGEALVLGLTFKENVPDLRNSRVIDVIVDLKAAGFAVAVHDPFADAAEALEEYNLTLDPEAVTRSYDLVVAAVAHDSYAALSADQIAALVRPGGCVADLKGIWRKAALRPDIRRWTL